MKKIFLLFLPVLVATSCNKQIDDIRPLTKIDKDGELASVTGITEATLGSYLLINSSGFTFLFDEPLQDLSEDRGNNVTLQDWAPASQKTDAFFFRNSNSPTSGFNATYYRGAYQLIVSNNINLEGIASFQASSAYTILTDADKNKVLYAKGENLFMRAFAYFNLVRLYGKPYYQNGGSGPAVPLKTSSDVKDAPSPATVKEVYAFIVKDLQMAAQLMKVTGVTRTNAFATTAAAWALLSRVFLYMGGSIANPDPAANQLAAAYADSVIGSTGTKYALLQGDAYQQMFGDDEFGDLGRSVFSGNKEILFAYDNAYPGSLIGELYNYDAEDGTGAIFLPSSDLLNLYVPADARGNFFRTNSNTGYLETTKWLVLNVYSVSSAPQIFLRMGEVYLNRAEANAKLGNMTKARADLKAIHTRAGLPGADVDALADGELLAAVLKERRMELAFEGHNSFDYFRNGLPMTRTAADNNGTELTIQPDDPKVIFTIPLN